MQIIMKRSIAIVLFCCLAAVFTGCGKGGGGGTSTPEEENLNVKLNTDNPAKSTSSSHTFTVEVLSKMPPSGVKVNVNVKREDNSAAVYSTEYTTTAAVSSVTISGLPMGQVYCVATVTVTSVTKSTNTWSGNFRVLWK